MPLRGADIKTVTYVEMTSPEDLRPGRPVDRLVLRRVGPDSPAITDAEARIGAPYGWRRDGDVEITTFGLLPEYVGRGWGGHALTMAVRQAWATPPLTGGTTTRVWLHTSTQDNPNALRNYLNRGFPPFRTEQQPI